MSSPQYLAPPRCSRSHVAPPTLQETNSYRSDTIYRDFEANLRAFDFDRFFATFPLDSPVCRFVESFSLSSLHDKITLATTSSSTQLRARRELETMLGEIDNVLRILDQAQFDVRSVIDTLVWLRVENTRALRAGESLGASAITSPNGLSRTNKPPPIMKPPQTSPHIPAPYWERYSHPCGPPGPAGRCPTCVQVSKTVSGAGKFMPEVRSSSSQLRRVHS